jgi:hypothetical protein
MGKSRSVSEVVIDLEQKVDTLLAYYRNMDANIKLLLSRSRQNLVSEKVVSNLSNAGQGAKFPGKTPAKPAAKSTPAPKPTKPNLPQTNIFETLKARAGVTDDAELTTEHDELIEEAVHKGTRRGARTATKPSGKISVSQQVLNDEGGPVFLASVEILDMSGDLVKQTRTNTKGRWVAPLEPGQYAIHIVKRSQDKPVIDLKFAVEIPESAKPLELDPPELE